MQYVFFVDQVDVCSENGNCKLCLVLLFGIPKQNENIYIWKSLSLCILYVTVIMGKSCEAHGLSVIDQS